MLSRPKKGCLKAVKKALIKQNIAQYMWKYVDGIHVEVSYKLQHDMK